MGVIAVSEIKNSRGSGIDDQYIRTYTRTFQAITDNGVTSEYVIRIAPGIPRVWDAYVSADGAIDLGCYCRTVNCKQTSVYTWEVTAEYSSKVENPDKQAENPLLRPADIKWSFAQYNKYVNEDQDGEPLVNFAGLRFKEGIEVEDSRPVLAVSKNVPAFDIAVAIEYQNAINSTAWWGVLPRQAKMQGIAAQQDYENGVFFWKVNYEIHFNRDLWVKKLLQMGTMQLKAGKLENITDKKGSVVTDPWPLKANGEAYGAAEIAANTPIVVSDAFVYKEKDFNLLNLP